MYLSDNYKEFILFSLVIISSIFFPFLSIFFLLIIISNKYKFINNIIYFIFISILILINSSKFFENDVVWYYDHYIWLMNNSIFNYFGNVITGVFAKPSEPLYYILFKIVGIFLGESKVGFLVIFTLIPYIFMTFAIKKIFKINGVNKEFFISGLVLVLSLGLTFTLSVHLMRQFMAEVVFLLAIACFFEKKYILTIFLTLCAFLTHNSILYIIVVSLISYGLLFFKKNIRFLIVPTALFLLYILSLKVSSYLVINDQSITYKDDGKVSNLVYYYDFFVYIIAILLYFFSRNKLSDLSSRFFGFVLMMPLVHYSILFGMINIPLAFLRFGFYTEVVRFLLLCLVFSLFSFRFKYNPVILIFSFIVGLLYMYMRLESSNFTYSIDLLDIIFFNIIK